MIAAELSGIPYLDVDHLKLKALEKGGSSALLARMTHGNSKVWIIKAGFLDRRADAVELHMGEPETFRELVLKNYYYATSLRRYLKKNERAITGHLNPFKRAFIQGFLRNPSFLVVSLAIVQIVMYITSLLGLLAPEKTSTKRDSMNSLAQGH